MKFCTIQLKSVMAPIMLTITILIGCKERNGSIENSNTKEPSTSSITLDSTNQIVLFYDRGFRIEGKFDLNVYKKKAIQNTYGYLSDGGNHDFIWLNADGVIYDFANYLNMIEPNKPLAKKLLSQIEEELANKLNILENEPFVNNKFWEAQRKNRIDFLKELGKLKRLTIEAYNNPDTLLSFNSANDTLNKLAYTLSQKNLNPNPDLTLEISFARIHKAKMKKHFSKFEDSIFKANMNENLEIINAPWGYHLAYSKIIEKWYELALKELPQVEWGSPFSYNFIQLFDEITFTPDYDCDC